MFSALLRTQLLATARVARPASRNLSVLARSASRSKVLCAAVASRSFTQTAVALAPAARNPPSNTVFLSNIPWSTTEEELRELLADFGQVTDVRMASTSDGRPRGFAHITFASKEDAEAAVTSALEEPFHLNGRDLYADFGQGKQDPQAPKPSNKLFFQGFEGDEQELRKLMSDFSDQILSIYFMRDKISGQAMDRGFVEFETIPQATTVLETLGNAEGVFSQLSYARPKRENPSFTRLNRDGGNRDRGNRDYRDNRSGGGSYGQRQYQRRDE